MSRVVVTGVGVMAPRSIGKNAFWENISTGRVFTGPVSLSGFDDLRVKIAGEIKDFNKDHYLEDRNGIKFAEIDRSEKMAIKSINMALEDSKLKLDDISNEMVISLGSTMGKASLKVEYPVKYNLFQDLLQDQDENLCNSAIKNLYPGGILSTVCKYFGLKNIESRLFLNACAAGNYSIGWGYDRIKNDGAQIAIVGGVDLLSLSALVGFHRLLSLTSDVCRPFDKNRKGLVVSEGCGILILEDLESAIKRKAHIYGEIKGYGLSIDAYHITAPRPDSSGPIASMKEALQKSQVSPEDIDYISAHGTGTKLNDKIESKAICSVFGENIPPVSSIKSMIGHSLGASAAIEAIACVLMIQNNMAVPTANFNEPDEDCPIDCIPNVSRKMKIDNIISNSFAFGGNNSSLVISRYKEV